MSKVSRCFHFHKYCIQNVREFSEDPQIYPSPCTHMFMIPDTLFCSRYNLSSFPGDWMKTFVSSLQFSRSSLPTATGRNVCLVPQILKLPAALLLSLLSIVTKFRTIASRNAVMAFLRGKLHLWIHVLIRVLNSPQSHHLCMPSNKYAVEQDQGATEPLLSHLKRADGGRST